MFTLWANVQWNYMLMKFQELLFKPWERSNLWKGAAVLSVHSFNKRCVNVLH